jgi:DNA-binding beta-propeller fold protein YncE
VASRRRTFALVLALAGALAACAGDDDEGAATDTTPTTSAPTTTAAPTTVAPTTSTSTTTTAPPPTTTTTAIPDQLAGMPPVLDAANVYAAAGVGGIRPDLADVPRRVYVPGNDSGAVTVIDQDTFEIVDTFVVGDLIQHVVPSWDMRTLYANASSSNELVPFDPITGQPGAHIRVDAPYNLYFTPDGVSAVVMAERRNRMDWYDPVTWERRLAVDVPCDGPNHADWTADGQEFVVTCEFSGDLLRVDTETAEILGVLDLGPGAQPQDVRLVPDGSRFVVADLAQGVVVVDAEAFVVTGLIDTGRGPHGIYPSRDGSVMYVSNRNDGSVAVIDPVAAAVVATWTIPGGGSPDMGGVTADGSQLWLSGRYSDEVYVFDTTTGELLARIPVPGGPHGLAVWPQPGRYSMGHTGNTR